MKEFRKPLNKNTQRVFDMTEDELIKEIEEYFDYCDKNGKPYLTIGLANHLKLHKQTMYDIRHDKTQTFLGTYHKDIFEMAHQRIEQHLGERLFDKNSKAVAGTIFALKCNFKWSEKQEIDINHNGNININFDE